MMIAVARQDMMPAVNHLAIGLSRGIHVGFNSSHSLEVGWG
jgi:hypothetical protein